MGYLVSDNNDFSVFNFTFTVAPARALDKRIRVAQLGDKQMRVKVTSYLNSTRCEKEITLILFLKILQVTINLLALRVRESPVVKKDVISTIPFFHVLINRNEVFNCLNSNNSPLI